MVAPSTDVIALDLFVLNPSLHTKWQQWTTKSEQCACLLASTVHDATIHVYYVRLLHIFSSVIALMQFLTNDKINKLWKHHLFTFQVDKSSAGTTGSFTARPHVFRVLVTFSYGCPVCTISIFVLTVWNNIWNNLLIYFDNKHVRFITRGQFLAFEYCRCLRLSVSVCPCVCV